MPGSGHGWQYALVMWDSLIGVAIPLAISSLALIVALLIARPKINFS